MLVSHGTPVKANSADVSVILRVIDSTDGTPETAVDHATSGIDLKYWREGGSVVDITEAALAALTTAHTDGGVEQIGAGYIRVDVPDAAFASGATGVHVFGNITGMVVLGAFIPLVAYDPQDTVRMGLTSLPNAAAEAPGGLYTRGTGAGQINQPANGMVDANVVRNAGTAIVASAGRQEVNLTHVNGTAATSTGGRPEVNTTHAAGTAWNSGAIGASTLAADTLTAAKIAADVTTELQSGLATAAALATLDDFVDTEVAAILAIANKLDTALELDGAVYRFTTNALELSPTGAGGLDAAGVRAAVGLASANLDTQLGAIDDFLDTEVAAIKTKTDFLPSATAGAAGGLFIAGSNAATTVNITGNLTGNVSGSVGSVTGAVGSVTGAVGSVTGNVGGNVTGSVGSVASGGISEASFATTAGPFAPLGIVDQGTAQAATGTTLQIRSAAAFADNVLAGCVVAVLGSTQGYWQIVSIVSNVGSTDTLTVSTFPVTPTGTITYKIFASPPADGSAVWAAVVDGSTTAAESMRLQNSAAAGKVSGAGTTTVVIRDLADSKDRINATVDSSGNRSAVTRNVTL